MEEASPPAQRPAEPASRRPYILLIIFSIALLYLLAFSLLNRETVNVSFVVASTTTQLIWVMLASALLGAALGAVGVLFLRHHRSAHGRTHDELAVEKR